LIHNLHSIDGEQRRSKHPGFNPHYMITALDGPAIREPNLEIDD